MDGNDPLSAIDSSSLEHQNQQQPWDLSQPTESFSAPESIGRNGVHFPPQGSPDSNGLPPCDHNLPAPSSCEQKSDQNQPAAGHQQPWDIPLTTGTLPEPTGEEAVVDDKKMTATGSSTSPNGIYAAAGNIKNKPEDLTIVEAELDPAGSIFSPTCQRNHGIAQPTEILLAMPHETDQDLPIKTGSCPSCEVKTSQEEPVAAEEMCHNKPATGSNIETGDKERLQSWEMTVSNDYGSTAILVSEEVDSKPPQVEMKSQQKQKEIVNDISREFEEASTKDEDKVYKDSCCGGCIGCCFQSVSCTTSNPCGRRLSCPISVSKKEQLLNTAALTKARRRGWDHALQEGHLSPCSRLPEGFVGLY